MLEEELYPDPVLDVDDEDDKDVMLDEDAPEELYPVEPERSRIFVAL